MYRLSLVSPHRFFFLKIIFVTLTFCCYSFTYIDSYSSNTTKSDWDYSDSDIALKFPFFNVLKDGCVHVFTWIFEKAPPSDHPVSAPGVKTKDVRISPDVSARLFLPASVDDYLSTRKKLPLLFYVHGGGFCMQSPFSVEYSLFVSRLVAEANVIAISIQYSLFPKRYIPACYEDCWEALQWVASHGKGSGPEPWVNDYADLSRIYLAGDSGGGNIAYNAMVKAGSLRLPGDTKVEGMILIHPFFLEGEEMWLYMCPTNQGPRDPRLKPALDDLATIPCNKMLVVLAENDELYQSGKEFTNDLIKSGWKGTLETMVNRRKEHVFHLYVPKDPEAAAINRRIASFIHHPDRLKPWPVKLTTMLDQWIFP